MAKKLVPIAKILTLLKQNPVTIAELTADLTPKQLRTIPEEGEWTAVELLEPCAPADWLRGAIVTGAGKPLQRTV